MMTASRSRHSRRISGWSAPPLPPHGIKESPPQKKWPLAGPFSCRCHLSITVMTVPFLDHNDLAAVVPHAVVAVTHLGARSVVTVLDDHRLGAGHRRGDNTGSDHRRDEKSEFLHDASSI